MAKRGDRRKPRVVDIVARPVTSINLAADPVWHDVSGEVLVNEL